MDLGRKKKSVISSVWALLGVSFFLSCHLLTQASASIVDSSVTQSYATNNSAQKKSFYANSRYWVFYSDGTNMVYKTSSDGNTWSGATSIRAAAFGSRFSVFFDGTHVHYAVATGATNQPIYYRRGTPNSDGSITWSAAEQTAVAAVSGVLYDYPYITVASDSKAWIGYFYNDGSNGQARVSQNNNTDGTWSTGATGTLRSTGTTSNPWIVQLTPTSGSGHIVAFSAANGFYIRAHKWTGSWSGSVDTPNAVSNGGSNYSVVNEGDDVHVGYFSGTTNWWSLLHNKYTFSTHTFASDNLVNRYTTDASLVASPVLSLNTSNNDLYYFWIYTTNNRIYYKKKTQAGNWDANPTEWINESADTFTGPDRLSSFYKSYGGQIGLVYMTKASSPYKIIFASLQPTAIGLRSFNARYADEGVLLDWQTYYEVRNLGFNVYREEQGKLIRLNPEIVAGTALLAGSGATPNAGRSYSWLDTSINGPLSALQYWLEDIDLNGKRTWHGPVCPAGSPKPLADKGRPRFLSEVGIKLDEKYRDFWKAQEIRQKLSQTGLKRSKPVSQLAKKTLDALVGQPKPASIRAGKLRKATDARNMQWVLADSPAVKIFIKEEGWYRVTQEELVAAGLDPAGNPRYLQMFVEGQEIPIRVISREGPRWDSLEAVEFYGFGINTVFSDTRVYWLTFGSKPGKRLMSTRGRGGALAPSSFPYKVEKKERAIYFSALKNGDENNFFGRAVTAEPVDLLLRAVHLDPSPPGNGTIEVFLQGVTVGPHRVKVLLNTVEVGEVTFEGQARGSARLSIPQSLILEGDNLITLIAQEGETDVSFIDSVELTYWRNYTAEDNSLKFSVQGGEYLSVGGFSGPGIRVIDITDPDHCFEVAGDVVSNGPSGHAVSFQAAGQGQRTFLVFTGERILKPADIKGNQPSAWHKDRRGGDLVIISHKDFLASLSPLKALREAQGWSVALVDVEDIYDEFSFGMKTPQALREFLLWSKARWPKPPRFVLLVGDASFDPRNYLGLGNYDFVPTKLVDTLYMETSSDDWFADFNGDGLPEMAVGRLPVRTLEEANRMISKIVGYERSAAPGGVVSLVADMTDGNFDFEAASRDLKALLPSTALVAELYRGEFPDDDQFRGVLLANLNQGPLLVNYIGHGSVEVWRGGVFDSADAGGLTNGSNLPFFVNMTCLNGFFHDLYSESLAESLLKAERGGALAVWTSSGLTEPAGQAMMNRELVQLLFNENSLTIGEAIIRAKAAVSDRDIRRSWILFGDPTTRLKRN